MGVSVTCFTGVGVPNGRDEQADRLAAIVDRHEAARLAAAIEPNLVMPVHYNTFPTLSTDARAFAADVAAAGVPVVLDET